jgi:hypothetical protein
MMHAEVLDEPQLEFGGGARHVDPRFGIATHGPADLNLPGAPTAIRLGLVGPADQLDGLRRWLERCREPIPAKDERYPHLFPSFPGCDIDCGLFTTLVFSDRNTRQVPERALRAVANRSGVDAITFAVDAYTDELVALAEEHRVDALLVARPEQLYDVRSRAGSCSSGRAAATDRSTVAAADEAAAGFENFHDLLKARMLHLRQPLQIIRRSTWDEAAPPLPGRGRQDEATRAWNLHIALYYKAGGVPWRLPRLTTDLTSCYVGVSFYRGAAGATLDTAVAHVFNERGDGVIVRGGPAHISREDRQPHLTAADAHQLLQTALDVYRREHQTLPARVVIHKSSRFTTDEVAGFDSGAAARDLAALDLIWLTHSEDVQLFRPGVAPPLRGTFVTLSPEECALYTRGSVEFYSTYPGMFVPHPIGIRPALRTRSTRDLAIELLALSKMNWNQSQLDGQMPITLRTADQVKRVLRFCDPAQNAATRYAQYM